jgi:hypothetical protein
MPQARLSEKTTLRTPIVRKVVDSLKPKPRNPSETLVEFIKVLEKIEATPEKIEFNSKYMRCDDGSLIEY